MLYEVITERIPSRRADVANSTSFLMSAALSSCGGLIAIMKIFVKFFIVSILKETISAPIDPPTTINTEGMSI